MKKIINNWLDQDLVEFLEHNLLYERAHWFGHSSVGESKNINDCFYSHELDGNEPINKYLFYKKEIIIKKGNTKINYKILDLIFQYIQTKNLDSKIKNFIKEEILLVKRYIL